MNFCGKSNYNIHNTSSKTLTFRHRTFCGNTGSGCTKISTGSTSHLRTCLLLEELNILQEATLEDKCNPPPHSTFISLSQSGHSTVVPTSYLTFPE